MHSPFCFAANRQVKVYKLNITYITFSNFSLQITIRIFTYINKIPLYKNLTILMTRTVLYLVIFWHDFCFVIIFIQSSFPVEPCSISWQAAIMDFYRWCDSYFEVLILKRKSNLMEKLFCFWYWFSEKKKVCIYLHF